MKLLDFLFFLFFLESQLLSIDLEDLKFGMNWLFIFVRDF
ncbi:hypothetical protein GLYMA_19G178301v4 [Glycine max]|nr:hypothetical protein GLYMA_19G178301v4 [Glycine max]KAH1078383.1 hypothetical protein GYH30_053406 [Glycine max]